MTANPFEWIDGPQRGSHQRGQPVQCQLLQLVLLTGLRAGVVGAGKVVACHAGALQGRAPLGVVAGVFNELLGGKIPFAQNKHDFAFKRLPTKRHELLK